MSSLTMIVSYTELNTLISYKNISHSRTTLGRNEIKNINSNVINQNRYIYKDTPRNHINIYIYKQQ